MLRSLHLQPRTPEQRCCACHGAHPSEWCHRSKRPDLHVFKEFTKRARLAVVVDSFLAQLPRATVLRRSTSKARPRPCVASCSQAACCPTSEDLGCVEGIFKIWRALTEHGLLCSTAAMHC